MEVKKLIESVRAKAGGELRDAVAAKPISAGEQHVVILSELSFGFGAGAGQGASKAEATHGSGGAGGGGAKASPVAVVVVEGGKVRLEKIGS